MIRALVVAAIMLVAASLEASAQSRIIFGEAGTTCGTWTQARQTKSRKAGLSAHGLLAICRARTCRPMTITPMPWWGPTSTGSWLGLITTAGRTLTTLSVLLP